MRKLGTLLTLSALALSAAPAAADAPPGNLTIDDSTCGEIVHSQGSSAYVDGQHYIVQIFAFGTEVKVQGQKRGLDGALLNCNLGEGENTLTVILVSQ